MNCRHQFNVSQSEVNTRKKKSLLSTKLLLVKAIKKTFLNLQYNKIKKRINQNLRCDKNTHAQYKYMKTIQITSY